MILANCFYAKGVGAGTVIKNRATLSYSLDGERKTLKSNFAKSVVAQVIDPKISWVDTDEVEVSNGQKKRVLTFLLKNSGNGLDKLSLISELEGYRSDFKVKKRVIYIDSNDNFRFDTQDKRVNSINLKEDEERHIFLVCTIPVNAKVKGASKSYILLRAISKRGGSGTKGKVHVGKGVKGVDAIDGINGGISEDSGIFKLLKTSVVLDKSVTQEDNGEILVLIDMHVEGEGIVKKVTITDKFPKDTVYVKNSLKLDDKVLSDKKDKDKGFATKKKIVVKLGTQKGGAKHQIRYRLRLK